MILGCGYAQLAAEAEPPAVVQAHNDAESAAPEHGAAETRVLASVAAVLGRSDQSGRAKAGRNSADTAPLRWAVLFEVAVHVQRGAAAAVEIDCLARIGAMTGATARCRGVGPRFPPSFSLAILREAIGVSW